MKGPEFCNKVDFDFNGASHRGAAIPKSVKTKINQANIPDELRPKDISVELEDDYTIVIHWVTQEWCWDTCDVADEIERYYSYYAKKLGLEEDILVILRIRSRDSYVDKKYVNVWNMSEYERLKEQRDVIKIPIYATIGKVDDTATISKISKDKLKIYVLDGSNIHWFYQTTGQNYSRAALYLDKSKPYIGRDDMGSSARLISKGVKKRGDGNTTWSGYKVDGSIKCYKIIDESLHKFSSDCYIDIETLNDYNDFPKGLFEETDE